MKSIDPARRTQLLQAQIDEANAGHPADFEGWRERTRAALRVVMGGDHPTVASFDKIGYGLMVASSDTPQSAWDKARADGVRRGIAVLGGAIHEVSASHQVGPSVDVANLHPWVAGAVIGLWDDGHYRHAVDEATRAIEVRMKAKIGLDLTGTPLVTEAFNPAPPKSGRRRLRFLEFEDGTQAWTDAHQGAMHFGQGCMLRIRNVLEHHDGEIDQQVAVECLAALSLLARWTDEAVVVEGAAEG